MASEFFQKLLSTPTAPYREGQVRALLEAELTRLRIPHFRDPHGNLIAGARSKAEYRKLVLKKSKEPVRFFIAHMDHPGFHGVKWRSPSELEVQWHGGSPIQHCDGAKVWIDTEEALRHEDGSWFYGTFTECRIADHGRAISTAVVKFEDSRDSTILNQRYSKKPSHLFGGFGFRAPLWKENGCFYTKAADDLVGCYAMLRAAERVFKKGGSASKAPMLALFSRAEEVGFVGAIAHLELGWLKGAKRPIIAVSLETSRTLPGAEIGKGPVVRLGDRNGVFDPTGLKVLADLAAKHLPNPSSPAEGTTRHQRRIMDAGSCEATAATAYGLRAIGISVPLGNYHNQGFQEGPDCRGPEGPAPEFVHENDVQGLLTLVHALMTPGLPWSDPWTELRARFKKSVIGLKKHASK